MDHCPTDQELHALLEQTLPPTSLSSVEAHLIACEICQHRMDALTSSADLVEASHELSSIPDAVLAKLHDTPFSHSPTVPDALPPELQREQPPRIPGFDIHHHIASGASGALYQATDQSLGRLVAVKVMHSSLARSEASRHRLQREARAVAAVNHPHVVAVHSSGEDDQCRPYMVMELIDGLSIAEHLQQHGAFNAQAAAALVEQAAQGLGAAHASGLIHRDVKSSNILIEENGGAAKVVDFGLVREDSQETQLTMDGMLAGTPAYISPEQIVNPSTVDARTDVYSLGIILYEMLTGTVPFRGVVRMTLQQVQHSEPQPPRQLNDAIPRDLQTICLKAIEKDPDRRYRSANEFGDDLRRFLNNQPIVARPAGRVEKCWRWCQRNRRISVLSALVALAILSTVGVTMASAYRLAVAGQEVQEADATARQNADALVVQRDAAMETVRKLVFDIPPLLLDINDDTSEVEKSILRIALAGLDKVGQSAEVSGEVDYNTAYALQQLGYALYAANELEDARIQLKRCLTLADAMKTSGEPISVTAALTNEVHLTLSDIAGALDDVEAEHQHVQHAIEAARAWSREQPEDIDAIVTLAQSVRLLGQLRVIENDPTRSETAFKEGRELIERVLAREPDNELALFELEEIQMGEESSMQTGRLPEADRLKRILQTELMAAQEHYAENIEDKSSRATLVSAFLRSAHWHTSFGNTNRAESMCERAKSLFDDEEIPPLTLLKIDRRLGDSYLMNGRTKLARNTFRDAVKQAAKIQALQPEDSSVRDLHSFCRLGLADAYSQQGNGEKSQPLYQQIVDDFSKSAPETPEQKMLLCEAKSGLAWSAWDKDDFPTAERNLAAVASEFETLAMQLPQADPDTLVYVNTWIEDTTDDLETLREFLTDE